MMMQRRSVLKWLAATPLALGFSSSAFGDARPMVDALILERPYRRPYQDDFGNAAIHYLDGNLTDLWFEVLDPLWRRPEILLGGITSAGSLFLIEAVAWQRSRRVISRRPLTTRGRDAKPGFMWVIAPMGL